MPAKAKKKSAAKRAGGKKKKTTRSPMSAASHDIAARTAGSFVGEVLAAHGAVIARDSKNKDAVQVSAKMSTGKKLALRITER